MRIRTLPGPSVFGDSVICARSPGARAKAASKAGANAVLFSRQMIAIRKILSNAQRLRQHKARPARARRVSRATRLQLTAPFLVLAASLGVQRRDSEIDLPWTAPKRSSGTKKLDIRCF